MAEANTRPVLPASAKAVSVIAAASGSQVNNDKEQPGGTSTNKPLALASNQQTSDSSIITHKHKHSEKTDLGSTKYNNDKQQQTPTIGGGGNDTNRSTFVKQRQRLADSRSSSVSSAGNINNINMGNQAHQSSASSSASSFASSFVSSETLTSNLRKIIASSSASIGRKLNLSSSSSSTSTPIAASPCIQSIATTTTAVGSTLSANNNDNNNDFETRQANYKHPVIQCAGSVSGNSSSAGGHETGGSDNTNKCLVGGSNNNNKLQPIPRARQHSLCAGTSSSSVVQASALAKR